MGLGVWNRFLGVLENKRGGRIVACGSRIQSPKGGFLLIVNRDRLGEHSLPLYNEVERGSIRRFAQALGVTDPISLFVEAAHQDGYRDLVAPPTYVVTLVPSILPGLELPKAGVLHGEQSFDWGEPICAGDVIEVQGWLDDVKTRSRREGTMTILTVVSEGYNQLQQFVFRAKAVLIVTEEVHHVESR